MRHVRILAFIAALLLALGASGCIKLTKPDPRHRAEWVAEAFLARYAEQDVAALEQLLANSVVLSYRNGDFEILPKQAYLDELEQRKANFLLRSMKYEIQQVVPAQIGMIVDVTYTGTECDLGAVDGSWEGDCFDIVGTGRLTLMPLGDEWRVTIIYWDTQVLYEGE